jgi:hypothetical protein
LATYSTNEGPVLRDLLDRRKGGRCATSSTTDGPGCLSPHRVSTRDLPGPASYGDRQGVLREAVSSGDEEPQPLRARLTGRGQQLGAVLAEDPPGERIGEDRGTVEVLV